MEAERYRRVCGLIDQVSWRRRPKKHSFGDALIVKVYFLATFFDRPTSWACKEANWPAGWIDDLIGTLPSQSTMSRRMRSLGVLQLIERVQTMLSQELEDDVVKAIDSKPLPVGSYSKDSDARRGRAAGEMARGYKLHAITCGHSFLLWMLTPMNTNDQVAAALLLPRLQGWGYVNADNGYDGNPVYLAACSANHQLVAPPRQSNLDVRDTRRNTAERIRSLDICADPLRHCGLPPSFSLSLVRQREQIERNFGNATMCGLRTPPPWVRRPHRVATWVAAKLIECMLRQVELRKLQRR